MANLNYTCLKRPYSRFDRDGNPISELQSPGEIPASREILKSRGIMPNGWADKVPEENAHQREYHPLFCGRHLV